MERNKNVWKLVSQKVTGEEAAAVTWESGLSHSWELYFLAAVSLLCMAIRRSLLLAHCPLFKG